MMPDTSPLAYHAINLPNSSEVVSVEALSPAEEPAILNDDVIIDVAPDRPGGTIRVKLAYSGRSTPIPADDPWAE
jgi:hypothetical protein